MKSIKLVMFVLVSLISLSLAKKTDTTVKNNDVVISTFTPELIDQISGVNQTLNLGDVFSSFAFSDDGMKLIALKSDATLYQYQLSSPYNINTPVQIGGAIVLGNGARRIVFADDGESLFYTNESKKIYQVDLTTSYDITTIVPASSTFYDLSGFTDFYVSFTISSDGTKIILINNNNKVLQIELSSAFDLNSAATPTEITLTNIDSTNGIAFSLDGTSALLTVSGNKLQEYSLQNAYDLSDSSRSLEYTINLAGNNTTHHLNLIKDKLLFVDDGSSQSLHRYLLDPEDALAPTFSVTNMNAQTSASDFITTLNYGDSYLTGNFHDISKIPTAQSVSSFEADGLTEINNPEETILEVGTYIVEYRVTDISVLKNSTTITETVIVNPNIAFLDKINTSDKSFLHDKQASRSFAFSADGMQLVLLRGSLGQMIQYNLTIPYDISTAVQSGALNTLNDKDNNTINARRMAFSPNGEYLFLSTLEGEFHKIPLTTAYDIETVDVDNINSLDLSSYTGTYLAFSFSEDGTELIFVNSTNSLHFALAEAYNIELPALSTTELDMPSIGDDVSSITFSLDGKRVLLTGVANDLYEYYLQTPYDLSEDSRIVADTINLNLSNNTKQIQLVNDELFFVNDGTTETLYRYLINPNVDLDLPTFTVGTEIGNFTTTLQQGDTYTQGIIQNPTDATSFITTEIAYFLADGITTTDSFTGTAPEPGTYIVKYTVTDTSPFEHSVTIEETVIKPTIEFVDMVSSPDQTLNHNHGFISMAFSDDNNYLTALKNDDNLYQYELISGFNLNSPTLIESEVSLSHIDDDPRRIAFSNDGNSLFFTGLSSKKLYKISLPQAYDLSEIAIATFDELDLSGYATDYQVFSFSADGKKIIFFNEQKFLQIELSTPFDLNSVIQTEEISMPFLGGVINSAAFSQDGTRVLIANTTGMNARIYEYYLQEAYDFSESSRVLTESVLITSGSSSGMRDITLEDDGALFVLNSSSKSLYRYIVDPTIHLTPPTFSVNTASGTYDDDFETTIQLGDTYTKGSFTGPTDGTARTVTYFEADGLTPIETSFSETIPNLGTYIIKYTVKEDGIYNNTTIIKETLTVTPPTTEFLDQISDPDQGFDIGHGFISYAFSADGKQLTALNSDDSLHQYELVSPYNLNNPTIVVSEISLSHIDDYPRRIAFSNDGSSLFFTGISSKKLYQISLPQPYDLSEIATATPNELDLSGYATDYSVFSFSSDGKKIILLNNMNVLEVDLNSEFDLTSVVQSEEFSLSSSGDVQSITFSSDGTRILIATINAGKTWLYEYFLLTAYDVSENSRALAESIMLTIGSPSGTRDISLIDNNLFFVIKSNNPTFLYRYDVSQGVDVTPPSFQVLKNNTDQAIDFVTNINVGANYTAGTFKDIIDASSTTSVITYFEADGITPTENPLDGTQPALGTYIIKYTVTDTSIYQNKTVITETLHVNLATEFLDKIITPDKSFVHDKQAPRSFVFSADGMQLVILRGSLGQMTQYNLTMPYDISTALQSGALDTLNDKDDNIINARRMAFSPNGEYLFLSTLGGEFYKIPLTTAYDIETVDVNNISELDLNLETEHTYLAFSFSEDGTELVFVNSNKALHFSLTDGFDLDTATVTSEFDMPSIGDDVSSITFSLDGTRVLLTGDVNNLYEYYLETPYDLSETSRNLAGSINLTDNNNTRHLQLVNNELFFINDHTTETLERYLLNPDADLDLPTFTIENHNGTHTGNFTTVLQLGETYTEGSILSPTDESSNTTTEIAYFLADGITTTNSFTGTIPVPGTYIVKYTVTDTSSFAHSTTIEETVILELMAEFINDMPISSDQNFIHGLGKSPSFIFSNDGMKMVQLNLANKELIQYSLSAPYNINNPTQIGASVSISDKVGLNGRIAFAADGMTLFLNSLGTGDQFTFYQIPLSSAYDIATINSAGIETLDLKSYLPHLIIAFSFSADGKELIFANRDNVLQFDLATEFDITSIDTNTVEILTSPDVFDIRAITFSSDGTRVLLAGFGGDLHEYYLQNPYDLSEESRIFAGATNLSESNITLQLHLVNDQVLFVADNALGSETLARYDLTDKVNISPKVFLQGAYNEENSTMNDDLRAGSLLETISPYADAITVKSAILSDKSTDDNIVDWVYVELRDKTNIKTVIAGTSALVQKDGDVVHIDGVNPLRFAVLPGKYFVVISHRNHLSIANKEPILLSLENNQTLDFTTVGTVKGSSNALEELDTGIYGMITGDTNADRSTNTLDVTDIIEALTNTLGYYTQDLNLDGLVDETDTNLAKTTVGKAVQE